MRRLTSRKSAIIGVDTGGTFTDFVALKGKKVFHLKIRSTPRHPDRAIYDGLKHLEALDSTSLLIHGSTVSTNTLLERKGARVAFVTTKGFEDLFEIGRQRRPHLYDLNFIEKTKLVPFNNHFSAEERTLENGKISIKLRRESIQALAKKISTKKKIDSVAVCLLFSFANNKHEKLLKAELKKLGLPISVSSELLAEYREYERASATVLNAYVSPVMQRYLGPIRQKLKRSRVQVMQSSGGVISIESAGKEAVRTLLSGPAGGVVGATAVAAKAGYRKIISFDMGGTSTDVCLVDGKIRTTFSNELDGFPLALPMMPIHTVGSGGGSIAWVDAGGALRVGPQSSGADPGPVCYGKGDAITITDAHLFLKRIHPTQFLGGEMKLFPEKIDKPLEKLAKTLRVSKTTCAEGIIAVANQQMCNAIRVISTQKGHDPRDFTLVSFGGAGALHACEMAGTIGIPRVCVPENPGTLSAFGMAISPIQKDYSKTILLEPTKDTSVQEIRRLFEPLTTHAKKEFSREIAANVRPTLELSADIRFKGQSYEINVPFSHRYRQAFLNAHRKQYGYVHAYQPIQIVTLRVRAKGKAKKWSMEKSKKTMRNTLTPFARSPFFYSGKKQTLPYFHRETFSLGTLIHGPAVICEYSATTFLPPGFRATVDRYGNLILLRSGK